jgi:hypothetical protein
MEQAQGFRAKDAKQDVWLPKGQVKEALIYKSTAGNCCAFCVLASLNTHKGTF